MNSQSPDLQEQSIIADVEPLSIILMIGDGMGYEHVELARLVEVGESGSMNMHDSDWNVSVLTHSANAAITDSAAAGTTLATGYKTNNGYISVSPELLPLETILEFAQTLNKSTGVVSTCRIVDATPASFMTHTESRYDREEMVIQIVEEADVDVLLGGGLDYFDSTHISMMSANGYSVVYNRSELASVTSGKVLGLFADVHMDYEYDRDFSVQPSIAEMTNKSIELLSPDSDGFFLMVEGGRIDLAAHGDDQVRNALDTIAFDEAVAIALDYVENHSNTILIVTADHETEGLVVLSNDLGSELPADLFSEEDKRTLRTERVNDVIVNWTASYHTDWPVPLFAYGTPFIELQGNYTIDNTQIFTLMKDYYLGNPLNVVEYNPTDTTTSDSTTTTTSGTGSQVVMPIDPMILTIAAIGVAVVVIFIIIRKR